MTPKNKCKNMTLKNTLKKTNVKNMTLKLACACACGWCVPLAASYTAEGSPWTYPSRPSVFRKKKGKKKCV